MHHHVPHHPTRLVEDTAWHPVTEAEMAKWDPTSAALYKTFLGTPLKLFASVGHWWIWHFDLDKYTEKQRPRVIISLAVVYAFMFFGLGALTYYTGIGGLVKYWLMPWLGYHFWMSTFTVVHHTAPHIPFKPAGEWNAAKAQLSGTVHCDFPQWWVRYAGMQQVQRVVHAAGVRVGRMQKSHLLLLLGDTGLVLFEYRIK